MIFFAFYLCIASAVAQAVVELDDELNDPFVQCYSDNDCIEYHNKFYCYAGLCTDVCPPGYVADHNGSEPTFTCSCDTRANFIPDGNFSGVFENIPKCKCSPGWVPYCTVTVWAQGIGYTDGLVPKGYPPNCKANTVNTPVWATTFSLILLVAASGLFMFINCVSCSWIIYDFHRYITIYVLATVPLIIFVQTVYPFKAGFTRSMAFGVIIHNSAEWNFLIRLQWGKTIAARSCANLCVMVYYIILLIAIAVLPLTLLLFVGMVQGGYLDYALLMFTCVANDTIPADKKNTDPLLGCCFKTARGSFQCRFGAAAAFHLMTVEVLFTGFVTNSAVLVGAGASFLIPMFLLYTLWASSEDRTTRCCGPSLLMNYEDRDGQTPSFLLKPYDHTTNLPGLMWQTFIGSRYPPKSTEEVELLEDGDVIKSIGVEIQDDENFKFGINDKCCCGGVLCNCCPIYWIGALLSITANGAILYWLPQNHSDCGSGYSYGVW